MEYIHFNEGWPGVRLEEESFEYLEFIIKQVLFVQYDNDTTFTFYDPAPPPMRALSPDLLPPTSHHAKDFALSPDPLASISDLSEQRIDLSLISVVDSPVSEPLLPPFQREQSLYSSSGRGELLLQPHFHQSTLVRNLSPYFVSQPPEVEFAHSPASSSSSLGCNLESSFPGFNLMGVQDLLLHPSNTSYDSNIDNLTVTDWVEKTLTEVINQNF